MSLVSKIIVQTNNKNYKIIIRIKKYKLLYKNFKIELSKFPYFMFENDYLIWKSKINLNLMFKTNKNQI